MSDTDTPQVQPSVTNLDRNSIRSKVLGESHKPKSKVIEFFGAQVEIRQPTLGSIIDAQARAQEDEDGGQSGIIDILMQRTYVPGTDELVFEDTDEAVLRDLPFGPDLMRVSEALTELSGVNFPTPAKS